MKGHVMMPAAIRRGTTRLAFDGRAVAQRVGLLALATDHTSEADFRRMVASETRAIYVARIAYANPTTPENLRRMQPRLTEGTSLILPEESLDVVYFGCTSASVVIGDAEVERAIQAAKPHTPVVTPTLAAVHALRALGARHISLLTPYTVETTAPMLNYFARSGFDLVSCICLGLDDDRLMARISHASLIRAAIEATHSAAEALFISCTALRAAQIAAEIERAVGRPVVTSNQAGAWMTLRLCGDERKLPQFGRLLTLPCPATGVQPA
jgi:maleate isomerase